MGQIGEASLREARDAPPLRRQAGLQGDGVKISRDSVLAQIAEKKRLIIETQPIGQRLDGARAVLERSRKRRMQAEETLLLAQKLSKMPPPKNQNFPPN